MRIGQSLVIARNVVNIDDIKAFIKKIIKEKDVKDAKIKKWLNSTFKKYLIDAYPTAQKYSKKPTAKDPDWLKDAVARGDKLYTVKLTPALRGEVHHVIDFFNSGAKFEKMSYKDAVKQSKKAFTGTGKSSGKDLDVIYQNKVIKTIPQKDAAKDSEVVTKLSDGYYVVHLQTKDSLLREGQKMQHCLRDPSDSWFKQASNHSIFLLSLRDKKGEPHATLEVKANGDVVQAKGKQNQAVDSKYHKYIHEFLKLHGAM